MWIIYLPYGIQFLVRNPYKDNKLSRDINIFSQNAIQIFETQTSEREMWNKIKFNEKLLLDFIQQINNERKKERKRVSEENFNIIPWQQPKIN